MFYSFVYQVINDLQQPFLGALHTVLGSLDDDTVTLNATAWEANRHTTEVVANLT